MGTLYREATSVFVFTTLFNGSQFLKKNIITHLGFFPCKSRPLTKGFRHQGRQIGSQKSVSLCRNGKCTRMCTHAPQSHQNHDVNMASLLCQDSPCYTNVKQRQFDVNRLRIYTATSKRRYFDVVGYDWAYRIIFYLHLRR